MGAPTLKKKRDLHYRRGPASGGCSQCNHYDPHVVFKSQRGFCGFHTRLEPRCKVMGLWRGRAFRINPNNICDAYESKFMPRLGVKQ